MIRDHVRNACVFVSRKVYNPDQMDTDGDNRGDVCDNCVYTPNPAQIDIDNDTVRRQGGSRRNLKSERRRRLAEKRM